MTSFLFIAAALAAQPSPIVAVPAAADQEPRIASFRPGAVRCDGVEVAPSHREEPLPGGLAYAPPQSPRDPIEYRFRISPEGRPLGIRAGATGPRIAIDTRDLAPALAAWRFPAGTERNDCRIEFGVEVQKVSTADPSLLHRYLALGRPQAPGFNQLVARAAWERLRPAGSTCFEPPAMVRQRNYPPFEAIPQTAGGLSYAFLTFDVDARGRPVDIRLAGSSGNVVLDREARLAVTASRYAPEPRRGCFYYYFKRNTEGAMPPGRDDPLDRYRPEGATCPTERRWDELPRLLFPTEFLARGIDGWAVVQFDLAPWGGVGNVRAVAAEPAEAFGIQAVRIVAQARAAPSAAGYRGCVDRVVFVLPDGPGPVGED
jgi:TonB family protein